MPTKQPTKAIGEPPKPRRPSLNARTVRGMEDVFNLLAEAILPPQNQRERERMALAEKWWGRVLARYQWGRQVAGMRRQAKRSEQR